MSFEKKSSYANKKTTIYSSVGFEDENIRDDTSVKMLYAEEPPNEGMMGDFKQDELKDKNNGTDVFPFEHRHLNLSVSNESLKSGNIQEVCPHPDIKDNEMYSSGENTDEEINLQEKSCDSNDTYCDEKHTDAKINHKKQNYDSHGPYCAEKLNCVITGKTKNRSDENDKENATRNNITAKGIFCKFVTWALEEKFYSGIMHNDSFINKVSKSLTG